MIYAFSNNTSIQKENQYISFLGKGFGYFLKTILDLLSFHARMSNAKYNFISPIVFQKMIQEKISQYISIILLLFLFF